MKAAAALVAALTLAGGLFLPWWWTAAAGYAVGFFLRSGGKAFLAGFLGAAVAWLLRAGLLDWRNGGLLVSKVDGLFHLPHPVWLYMVTLLVGGLAGGLGGWAGQAAGDFWKKLGNLPDRRGSSPSGS